MGVIDAPPLNIGKDKAYISSKPIKVEKGNYLKVKPIDPKKFSIWYDVNGCNEVTLAITPLKSERQAKEIKKDILRHFDDLIFWQDELRQNFGEVDLANVVFEELHEILEELEK